SAAVSGTVLGVEGDRFLVIGDGAIVLTVIVHYAATIDISLGTGRIDADGFIEVGQCPRVVAFPFPGETPHGIGTGVLGIESDGLRVVGDRQVILGLVAIGIAAAVKSAIER